MVGALGYRDPSCYTQYYELHMVKGSLLAIVVERCETYDVVHVYKVVKKDMRKVLEEVRPHQSIDSHLRFLDGRLGSFSRK